MGIAIIIGGFAHYGRAIHSNKVRNDLLSKLKLCSFVIALMILNNLERKTVKKYLLPKLQKNNHPLQKKKIPKTFLSLDEHIINLLLKILIAGKSAVFLILGYKVDTCIA